MKAKLAKTTIAQKVYKAVAKKKPLGEGSRFKAVMASAKAGGAKNPAAVAAMIGMKKYGKVKMMKMAIKGKKSKTK